MTTCRGCGVEITPDNAYGKGGSKGAFRPPKECKVCENKSRAVRKAKLSATRFLFKQTIGQVVRRKYFDTKVERDHAMADRTTLKRFGTLSLGRSSPIGTAASATKELLLGDKVLKYQDDMHCEECGGLVRTNPHYEKECEVCGVVVNTGSYLVPEEVTRDDLTDEDDPDSELVVPTEDDQE